MKNQLNNARYRFTEEKIEKAVFTLLKRRGYDKFTIKDVCIEAGINRSSFYSHYQDINDLMIKIEGNLAKQIQAIWQPSDKSSIFGQDNFVDFFSFIKDHREFYKSFLKSGNQSFVANEMLKRQSQVFKQALTKNNLNYSESEIDYHLHFFGGGLKAICGRWIQNDCKETPEQMAKIIYDEYANNAKYFK